MESFLDQIVPLVAVVMGISVALFSIYTKNKERLALIEKGINPNEGKVENNTPPVVKALAYMGVGIGLFITYFLRATLEGPQGILFMIAGALVGGGLGYFIGLRIHKNDMEKQQPNS